MERSCVVLDRIDPRGAVEVGPIQTWPFANPWVYDSPIPSRRILAQEGYASRLPKKRIIRNSALNSLQTRLDRERRDSRSSPRCGSVVAMISRRPPCSMERTSVPSSIEVVTLPPEGASRASVRRVCIIRAPNTRIFPQSVVSHRRHRRTWKISPL